MIAVFGRGVMVIAVLHLIAAGLFGTIAHIDTGVQFPDLVTNDDADFAVSLYANRNIGVAVGLLVALALRRAQMVAVMFVVRFVTDVGDFVSALAAGTDGLAGQLVFFGLLFASELYVLGRLWPTVRDGSAPPAPSAAAG